MIDDGARIRAAIDLLHGNSTPESQAILATGKVTNTRRLILVMLVAAVFGGVVGFFGTSGRDRNHDLPGWRTTLGWSVWVLGVLACVVFFVQMRRSGGCHRGRSTWLKVLTFAQRRSLVRQVRGRDVVVREQIPLTREIAGTMTRSANTQWVTFAALCIFLGNALRSNSTGQWVIAIAFAVLAVYAAIEAPRQLKKAKAFLAETAGDQ